MTKKRETEVTKKGAVELTEDALDQVQGASGDFHIKFDAPTAAVNKYSPAATIVQKVDIAPTKPIVDGTSNAVKL
jgi:hypothetical protein